MISRWERGRSTIDELLSKRELERVHADRELAREYIAQSRAHLSAARSIAEQDPIGSFQLAYDSGRKALAGILIAQGLRPTSRGGHRSIEEALRAQLVPPLETVINAFGWMRTVRNASEYPSFDSPVADIDDAASARAYADTISEAASRLIDELPVY